jgi:transposase-like protein
MITANGSDNSSVTPGAVLPKLPVIADTKGRLRVSKAQRRDILAALGRSGEGLPQFARRTGLKYSTLANWAKHSRRGKRSGRQPRLRLLEAVVESPQAAATGTLLVLQLPGGVRVEVADEKQVALAAVLVRELSRPC